MIKLSIIIPYHDEDISIIYPLFKQLNNQKNIDFNELQILICRNDGVPKFPNFSCLTNISNIIEYHTKKCKIQGPGQSRQIGLDISCGEYVAFFDCDDALFDEYSISKLIGVINDDIKYDVIDYKYCRNLSNNIVYYNERPWEVWAAIYNKKFLIKNHIMFNSNIYLLEDVFFTICTHNITNVFSYKLNEYIYVYNIRNSSTMHSMVKDNMKELERLNLLIIELLNWGANKTNFNYNEFLDFVFSSWEDFLCKNVDIEKSIKLLFNHTLDIISFKKTYIDIDQTYPKCGKKLKAMGIY